MNNREFNSFSKNLNTYKNFVPATTLKKLSNRVKYRRLEPGNALVKAYNQASVNYEKKTYDFYFDLLKSSGVKYATNRNFRKIVSNAMSKLPKQPPCIPYEGGKSGRRKSGEAIARCVGNLCVRGAQGVGRTAKSIVGLGRKNTRVEQTKNIRVEKIRYLVRNGVLKNIINKNKNNMRSKINSMPENKLRSLAFKKGIRIPRDINTMSDNQLNRLVKDKQLNLVIM
jgi:hypothetical protein